MSYFLFAGWVFRLWGLFFNNLPIKPPSPRPAVSPPTICRSTLATVFFKDAQFFFWLAPVALCAPGLMFSESLAFSLFNRSLVGNPPSTQLPPCEHRASPIDEKVSQDFWTFFARTVRPFTDSLSCVFARSRAPSWERTRWLPRTWKPFAFFLSRLISKSLFLVDGKVAVPRPLK